MRRLRVRLIQGAIDVWQAAHRGQPWSTFATFSLAMATPVVNYPELDPDLGSILHEEIDRLPEVERLPVVLCDLEGLTYEQAAGCLHWAVPALGCRLAKARKQLWDRLIRRGLTYKVSCLPTSLATVVQVRSNQGTSRAP